MCCLLSESLLFLTLKIEIFVFSLSNLLNKNLPGSFLSWKTKNRFFFPLESLALFLEVGSLILVTICQSDLCLPTFGSMIYQERWPTRNSFTNPWNDIQRATGNAGNLKSTVLMTRDMLNIKATCFLWEQNLKHHFEPPQYFFVDLTILVGRVIWLQLFQVTFLNKRNHLQLPSPKWNSAGWRPKIVWGRWRYLFFPFFFAAIMSCDAGGEDHSKNWSVKRQRNSCFWLESCEKPGFFGRSCPKCLFFGTWTFWTDKLSAFLCKIFPKFIGLTTLRSEPW